MEFRTVGPRAGETMQVSLVGLGCNAFGRRIGEKDSIAVVHAALDAGITFFDTAESYGDGKSETWLGKGLGRRRKDVVIATKFGWGKLHVAGKGGGSRANIEKAVEGSLKRLGTNWIDLYQLHKPDPSTPVAETLDALDALVRAGKVRYVGCSNFSGAQLAEAAQLAASRKRAPFVTAQNEYNVFDRAIEGDLLPVCRANGVRILPYYPIARGLLTGKYRRGKNAPKGSRLEGALSGTDFATLEALEDFATARGHTVLELAMSWLGFMPETASVIAGASRPEQLAQNAAAMSWRMTAEERTEIDRIVGR
jgi:aryl-alcohol dehydrogenase-like predicted oxidoreductase